jgi:hypothetical protein
MRRIAGHIISLLLFYCLPVVVVILKTPHNVYGTTLAYLFTLPMICASSHKFARIIGVWEDVRKSNKSKITPCALFE